MKSIALLTSLAASVVMLGAPAGAQSISGKYIVTVSKFCPLTTTVNFATAGFDYVDGLGSNGSSFKQSMLLATFNQTNGTVTVNGLSDGSDLVIYQLTGVKHATLGNGVVQSPESGTNAYSNTATTFTIGGVAFNADYGQIKKGVAHYVVFQGDFTNPAGELCFEQGTISRQ